MSTKAVVLGTLAVLLSAAPGSAAKTYTTLYAFGGTDGAVPRAALVADKDGNLYGTTQNGGDLTLCHQQGCGTVFKLLPGGGETVLHVFEGRSQGDGAIPDGALILDKDGNLYGTTVAGGDNSLGTAFRLAPDGTETILHAFTGPNHADGSTPSAGLVRDGGGNLYGTTIVGGNSGCNLRGCGTVYRIAPGGTESIVYDFTGGSDGASPGNGALVKDDAGNLYGTTVAGGDLACGSAGCGVVYKLTRHGHETVLHAFSGGGDGTNPIGGLTIDAEGSLYGTTQAGGGGCANLGCGTVFKIAPDGTYSVLYAFAGGSDGGYPFAAPLVDRKGNLYGTTDGGGDAACNCGTVFKLAPDGGERVLHAFTAGDDGRGSDAPLISVQGTLFGTTYWGGGSANCPVGCGTVFKLQ
jgi:uncharacterized repeat protein (TIGR03803 family)